MSQSSSKSYKKSQDIFVFEAMSQLDVLWASFLALMGKRVRYVKKPKRNGSSLLVIILRKHFFRKRIKPCRIIWKNDVYDGMWGDQAFSAIDKVYAGLIETSFNKMLLRKFSLAAELAIKKELVTHLSRFFYLNSLLNLLSKRFDSRIILIPASGIKYEYYITGAQEAVYYGFLKSIVSSAGVSVFSNECTSFSILVFIRGYILIFLEWLMRYLYMAIHTTKYFFISLKSTVFQKPRQSWRYGLMIMSLDRQFQNDSEGLDFLIDNVRIKNEEMIFIPHSFVRLSSRELAYLERKKLNYIRNLCDYYSLSSWISMSWTWIQTIFFSRPLFLLKVAHTLCLEWALWESFSYSVHLDNVIGHHDVSIGALCRNILLEKHQGTRSWLYIDANNFGSFFSSGDGQIRYKTNFYSFMRYDYVVSWNNKIDRILLASHNKVNVYYNSGCLWSTFIVRQQAINSYNRSSKYTIVIFDSSYNDYSLSKSRYALFFHKGIFRLLEELDGVRILLKPKKARKTHELMNWDNSIFQVVEKLAQHPRCVLLDYTQSRGEVIAQADLVIAYPFTSAAFEAVCAGVPSIFFDATGAFPESAYQECGMVASGYADLKDKVERFLTMPKIEFYKWREKNRLTFDGYLDGRGLDRFIERLAASA